MTGYGHASAQNADYKATVELKSINSRSLEVHVRLPSGYFKQEAEIKNLLAAKLVRGKITLNVSVEILNPAVKKSKIRIDEEAIISYYVELQRIAQRLGVEGRLPLAELLRLPGVVEEAAGEPDPQEWAAVSQALHQAVERLVQDRRREGKVLEEDFKLRLEIVAGEIAKIQTLDPLRIAALKNRLAQALKDLGGEVAVHEDRYNQEVLYYLEKYDVHEEKVRLSAHVEHFAQVLENEEQQGKKLNFIVQEMWREANTLGVKAYDAQIQQSVVVIKDELEKLKEQLMNVL